MLGITIGDLGSGKTGLVTAMAGDAVRAGVPVFSNYNIRWRGCEKFFVSDLLNVDVDKGFIACDEVYTLAESRISSSKLNRFFSYFLFQSRKLHVDVESTAQLESTVDLRLVGLANLVVLCEYDVLKRRFNYTFVKNGLKVRVSKRFVSFDWMMEHVFPFYDTDEVVNPLGLVELQVELEKYDVGRINKRVDCMVDWFVKNRARLEFRDAKSVYGYVVEDEMFREGFPLVLSKFVVNRLKNRLRLS